MAARGKGGSQSWIWHWNSGQTEHLVGSERFRSLSPFEEAAGKVCLCITGSGGGVGAGYDCALGRLPRV